MNKIVLEHYPVEKLPEDLREMAGGSGSVTLTIVRDRPTPLDRDALVAELRAQKSAMKPGEGTSLEEATARIRALRDEWED